MSRKKMRVIILTLLVIFIIIALPPTYIRQALIHWYPDITDTYIFPSNVVSKSADCWDWSAAKNYNEHVLSDEDSEYMDKYKTLAYLVIQNDSVLYEEYRDKWGVDKIGNIFSATKSIVGLLTGIAWDEGYIESLDDKVSKYLPEFNKLGRENITIRNLLTMSSGLDWDEAYTSLFSKTTEAYYGDDIRELVMNLKSVEPSGIRYSYKSCDTQILSFVIRAALERDIKKDTIEFGNDFIGGKIARTIKPVMTISQYAEEKLWQPMQACNNALWNLDKKDGVEKTYCCFNTTARDLARFGRLILNGGKWNDRQIISEAYLNEAISPASYLENEFGDGPLDYYGFQIWIVDYEGMKIPTFRGLDGQYMFAIPDKNAIVVRLGHKRSDIYEREKTIDLEGYLDIAFKILK